MLARLVVDDHDTLLSFGGPAGQIAVMHRIRPAVDFCCRELLRCRSQNMHRHAGGHRIRRIDDDVIARREPAEHFE